MALINSGSGGYIGRKFDVQLSAELRHKGDPIFERYFNGNSTGVVNIFNDTILIPNHFFRTGEKLTYEYADFENTDDNAVGIGTTIIPSGATIQSLGITTSRLPLTCYAVKIDDRTIKLSPTKEDALKRIPEVFDLRAVGYGTYHKFIGEKQNTRSLITIDNVIQSPAIDTVVKTKLIQPLSGASDLLFVAGITSFFTGDLIRVEDELMRINLIGLGETTSMIVRRPMLGTKLADHPNNSDVVRVSGNYQIVDNIIYFPVPPFEKSPTTDFERKDPLDRDYVGLETFSTFDGRVFLRSGFQDSSIGPYDRNYLLDDISQQFLGISTQAVLKQKGQDIAGFSTGNALILINNVFQTPDFIDYGLNESAGITTIKFTGSPNSNPKDINQSSIPRGGIIVQVGTNEGGGYQPLVAAGGTALVSAAGTISKISIGYTGSGYRAPKEYILKTRINWPTNSPSSEFFVEDQNGLFKQLKYFINSNPQATCTLSVKDSVGINKIVNSGSTRITSVGSTSIIISSGIDAWNEVSLATSYVFYSSTNVSQPSIGSTDRIRVASVSGIDTTTQDYYANIASVATNIKIKDVDINNKFFILESPTSGGYVDNTPVVIKTQIDGIDNTNIEDIVYITVTNPNLGIANIYVNTNKEYSITNAPYTNTTGIVTITVPDFEVSEGDIVEIRDLKYKCLSGGSFDGNFRNFNVRVGIQSVYFSGSGIATVTTDGNVANTLSSGDLVLFNNTSTVLDGKTFTVSASPVTFGSATNSFRFNLGGVTPPSNILNSPGYFVLATLNFPSGNLGYNFEVLDKNGDDIILNVGKAPQNHDYVSGGIIKNVTQGKILNHIGISTIYDGHITNAELTNTGIGFTQYNLFAQYNLLEAAQSGVNTLRLGNISGIDTYRFYVSVGTAITNSKIINLDSSNKIITIGSTVPSSGFLNETSINIKKYDDFDLYIDDPISHQDLNLVYSPSSPQGIGSYANANVKIGNDGKIKEFELLTTGYSFGQGEILTLPTSGPTGLATFGGVQLAGISKSVGVLTGSISTTVNDRFGYSLSSNYDGTSFIIGCPYDNYPNSESNSGVAYVFDRVGVGFTQVGIITGLYANNSNDNFGWSVAMSGDGLKMAISAPSDTTTVGINTGLVYLYDRSGNNFNQVGILTGSYAIDFADRFGWAIDMSYDGNTIVVGAISDEFPSSANFSGVAYVFTRSGLTFSQVGVLTGTYASNIVDYFGYSVSISSDGNYIAVGAIADEDNLSGIGDYGVSYVFKKIGSTYNNIVGILTSPKPANQKLAGDNFGNSIAISDGGKIVCVGATLDRTTVGGVRSGVVYVFEYIDGKYYVIDILQGTYSTDLGDSFGSSLSMSNDGKVIAVGADSDERPGSLESSGVVYLYDRRTENYLGEDYVLVGFTTGVYSKDLNDKYGTSVHVSSNKSTLIAGSIFDSANNVGNVGVGTSGVVYVHDIQIGNIFQEFQITIDQTFTDEFSGYVFGDLVVFDSFDRLFNGRRIEFPIKLGGVQRTLRARPGSVLDLEYNLLVFLNDIYQVPNQSYTFKGGSFINFIEPPQKGDKCVVIFYYGTTAVDTRLVDILETIKIGDEVTLNSQFLSLQQDERVVTDIRATDIIETNVYSSPGLSLDPQLKRPITWCKQLVDKIIDGNVVGKSRIPYEPEIYPKTQLIQGVGIGSTDVIFVESLKTFFDSDDEYENIGINKAPQNNIVIISNDVGIQARASITVGSNLRISSINLLDGGSNYQQTPDITISLPNYVGIGTTDFERATASCLINSSGVVTSITLTNPGYGYTNTSNPLVLISPPETKYELIEDVFYQGDFGWITGIGTTSTVGFKTNFVFELYIPENSYLRDPLISGISIKSSTIQKGYYFKISRSNVGNVGFGFTSVSIYDNKNLFFGDQFLDGIYQVSSVGAAVTQVPGLSVGSGRTEIIRVIVPVKSYNGLDIPSGGFIGTVGGAPGVGYTYGKYFGDFSWGRISELKRTNSKTFSIYTNGSVGIQSSPSVIRLNPLKYLGYTPNPED